MKYLLTLIVSFFPWIAVAQPYWETIDIGSSTVDLFIMAPKNSKTTVLLLPGGPWVLGGRDVKTQRPKGRNFLVRSAPLFFDNGLTTVIMDKPSNAPDLNDGIARTSNQHADDILAVATYLKKKFDHPVWLIGTSRGTQSAAAAAIRDKSQVISGLVLSASMLGTNRSEVSLLGLDLDKIRVPVYVSHHQKDECGNTNPQEIPLLVQALTNAPKVQVKLIESGHSPTERVCGPMHWHGYINAEAETVNGIASWIKSTY